MEQNENTLSVLKIAPGQYPQQVEIDNNLKALQEAVGGTIAAVYPFADPVAIICNDDGKLMGLPLNRALRDENGEMYDAIAGDFLVVGLGEEDFASLTPELAQKYEQLFHQPEAFLKLGNRLLVLPVPDEPPAEKPHVLDWYSRNAAFTARRTVRADSFVVEIIMLNDFCSISSCAKKYGIDYAIRKDTSEVPPRYLVFFKAPDAQP